MKNIMEIYEIVLIKTNKLRKAEIILVIKIIIIIDNIFILEFWGVVKGCNACALAKFLDTDMLAFTIT